MQVSGTGSGQLA